MKLKLICFGITRDITGSFQKEFDLNGTTVNELKEQLVAQFPTFSKLKSLRIAINEEYAEDTFELSEKDEVVLIPPVSGG